MSAKQGEQSERRTNFQTLYDAEDALLRVVKTPFAFVQELRSLCQSCGWTLAAYQNECLDRINNNWEPKQCLN